MPKVGYLAFIAYWLTFEYIHLQWELTWPWLTVGNAFAEYPSLVQWYEFTGVFGGGIWIMGLNVLFFSLLIAYQQKQPLRKLITRISLIVALPVIVSLVMYFSYEEKGNPQQVIVVQPNLNLIMKSFLFRSGSRLIAF